MECLLVFFAKSLRPGFQWRFAVIMTPMIVALVWLIAIYNEQ